MPPNYGNNGQLSRDERVQLYGIDCEDQVIWHDWTPGVESVCDLVLQNVALVTQKVKFKLPPTKEFDMPYPEPFKLAPGMKKSLPISFRPSKYEPHVDQVQIITKNGSFFVTVKAMVKDIALTVRNFLDFGLCPTAEKSEMHVDVYNTGTLKATMKWHARPPFSVRCPSETIEVGQMQRCVVDFEPQTASVFDALVVCEARQHAEPSSVDEDATPSGQGRPQAKTYSVQCTGVGKMPHLSSVGASHPHVDFGPVFPGTRTPKTLEILNATPVRATFRVRALHDQGEVMPLPPFPFSVSPDSGVVEANGTFTLTFHFQSHTVKEYACQRFKITTPGGTPMVVTCTAFLKPIEVRLSTRSINYGEVSCGKVYSRTLQIHNDSDRPAAYHFVNMDQKAGVFTLDRPQGVVPANSFMVVTASFGPMAPINCHKEVACVVKGALTPLTLHLLGSGYTENARPARLDQRHVDLFKGMQLRGVREHAPPQDGAQRPDDRTAADEEDEAVEEDVAPTQALSATQTFLEMMLPMDSKLRDITVQSAELDFGSCSTLTMSDKQVVTITNRTSHKVCVTWMMPGETRMPCTANERALMSVYPTHCDIAPRGQHDFTVSFRPRVESAYEGEILEAVVYQKVNRSFRLVDTKRFTPPWTVAIRGMGHTMGATRNDPRLDITESHVRFRPCYPGERAYQIAMFTNPGDTTISYRILPPVDSSSGDSAGGAGTGGDGLPDEVPFRAFPTQGTIEPHQFHLVVLEFAPTQARNERAFVASFQVVVNYNERLPKTLRVAGRAWEPTLAFCRGQSMVTFPPTCSGIASSMECIIKNISEIPITYECKIPTRFRSLFWFSETIGQLRPSESASITANFCPSSEKVFSAPLYCVARCVENADSIVEGPLKALLPPSASADAATPTYVLQLVGHGKGPAISLEPDSLDLGAVRACDEVRKQVTILNSSNLTVHFLVSFEFKTTTDELPHEAGVEALQLECSGGEVAGRCTKSMDITFRPHHRGLYEYRIIVMPKGDAGPNGRGIELALRAEVQYPFIQVADLRTEAATLQPQSIMWAQFQVDGINALYRGGVTEVERKFQAAIGIDEKKTLKAQLKAFQLLFGTSAAGSTPTIVYLTLANPSKLKIRFSFQTPRDLNLQNAPYWCDEKALVDDREAHFTWVEEHHIYDIQPRSGEIHPGDFLHVKMTYHHHSIGTHILPVAFNVHDGRSVLMYLKAHSVAPNVGCLSVRSSVVALQPVPLNVACGTTQPVELTNSGCIAAPWRIDMQSIYAFNMENHDFEVLAINPVEGLLQPQTSTFLQFTFTPLEAKSYMCPVRIEMLKDGRPAEELLFELRAEGYDPDSERPAAEPLFPPSLPIQTYAPVPGCGAALSIEILDFGHCPLRAWASRMLVLVNYTSEFVLSYRWEPRKLFQDGQLRIEPSSGELAPESHSIIVFRLCSDEPVDVSGEVACFLEWTHITAYGQTQEVREEGAIAKAEYLAFHSDHIHEPMRTGKAFIAGEHHPHISVANRLTVSRFRNLMSTAAGQKFLNENLHRTALLASHIPTMSTSRAMPSLSSSSRGVATGSSDGATRGYQQPLPNPSSNPLFVRIRAVVADWEIPADRKSEFLVLSSAVCPDPEKEDDSDSLAELQQTRRAIRSGGGAGIGGGMGPEVVMGFMEHLLREVIAETTFSTILDNMLAEESPFFVQYEDSAPPGDRAPPPTASAVETMALLAPVLPQSPAGTSTPAPGDAAVTTASSRTAGGRPLWSSGLLLHFEAPDLAPASPVVPPSSAASPAAPGRVAGGAGRSAASASAGPGECGSPTSAAGVESEAGVALEDAPQRFWEEALADFGEVDLETFRRDAGEVLEGLLLEMVDDVIAGRLNWMRPLPRARVRR